MISKALLLSMSLLLGSVNIGYCAAADNGNMELLRPPPLTTRTVKSIHGIEKIIEELHKQNPGSPVYVFLDFDDVLSAQVKTIESEGKPYIFNILGTAEIGRQLEIERIHKAISTRYTDYTDLEREAVRQALNFVLVGLGNSDKFKETYNPEETGDEKLIEAIKAMGKVYILSGLEDNDKRLDFAEKTYGKHLSRHYRHNKNKAKEVYNILEAQNALFRQPIVILVDNNPFVGEDFSKGMSELATNNRVKMSAYFIHDTHFQDKIEKATDEIIKEVKMALEVTLKENTELSIEQRKLLENVKSELSEKTSKS